MSEEIKKNRRRKITCPHCSNAIWVGFVTSIEIDGVSTSQGSVDHHVTLITPGQAEFLRNATYDGLMTAFKEAVSESNVANHAPKDIGKFLQMESVSFLALALAKICLTHHDSRDMIR